MSFVKGGGWVCVSSLAATHHKDAPLPPAAVTSGHPGGELEYDAHNLYGTAMAQAFAKAFKAVSGKRNFQLTR